MLNPHIKTAVPTDRQGEAFCACECEIIQNSTKEKKAADSMWEGGGPSCKQHGSMCCVGGCNRPHYRHIEDCSRYSAQDAKADRERIPALKRKNKQLCYKQFSLQLSPSLTHMTLIMNLENTSGLKFPAVQSIEVFKEESSSILRDRSPAAMTWYWHIHSHSPSAKTGRER